MGFNQPVIRGQVGHFHVHWLTEVRAARVFVSGQDHRIEQLGNNGFALDTFVCQAV